MTVRVLPKEKTVGSNQKVKALEEPGYSKI